MYHILKFSYFFIRKLLFKLSKNDSTSIFTKIYKSNYWKSSESVSGTGSELIQTSHLVVNLNQLLREFSIKSILDLPCGDFRWMKNVDLNGVHYLGGDIVEELIKKNKIEYEHINYVDFSVINLISDPLPKVDLVIVRDCFVHLSFDDIFLSLNNLRKSGSKYLLTTVFTECGFNYDIATGDWRRLNFDIKPFFFPKPILIINEKCTEGGGRFKDKSMALWFIDDITIK